MESKQPLGSLTALHQAYLALWLSLILLPDLLPGSQCLMRRMPAPGTCFALHLRGCTPSYCLIPGLLLPGRGGRTRANENREGAPQKCHPPVPGFGTGNKMVPNGPECRRRAWGRAPSQQNGRAGQGHQSAFHPLNDTSSLLCKNKMFAFFFLSVSWVLVLLKLRSL